MAEIYQGQFTCRRALTPADVEAVQRMRASVFHSKKSSAENADEQLLDCDEFDGHYTHLLIEDQNAGELVGSFRYCLLNGRDDFDQSYSAQFYDLKALSHYQGTAMDLGRFCTYPLANQLDVLRAAWSLITSVGEEQGVRLLFGCASFEGTDPLAYPDAFGSLRAKHVGPEGLRPGVKAAETFDYVREFENQAVNGRQALTQTPPLLRFYLGMGGWVSDHAVIDRDLGTVHVFTALEVDRIPEGRLKTLHRMAQALASSP